MGTNGRVLLALLCVALLTGVNASLSANDVDADSILQVPKAAIPPIIDGKIDGVWKNVSNTYMTSYGNSGVPPDDTTDLFGWFRLMWDEQNFYGLFYAQDEALIDFSASFWDNDGWGIYFDSDFSHGTMYDGVNDQTIWLEHKDVTGADINWMPWDNKTNIELVNKDTLNGYMLELRVPMAELQLDPTPRTVFGFEVQQNDNDGMFREHISKWWAQSGDEAWHDPSTFGIAMLTDQSVTELLPVHRTPTAPLIDGVLDDLWLTNSVRISQNSYSNGAELPDSYEDLQGEFRLMWDDNNFYGFFITSDEVLTDYNLDWWQNDVWTFYFDSDNSKGVMYDNVDDQMIAFEHKDRVGADIFWVPYSDARNIEFKQVDHPDGSGYTLEFKIPLADLKLDPTAGSLFGFEAQQNDNDAGINRQHISKWWLDVGDNSWMTPSVFGTAVLVDSGGILPPQLRVTYPNAPNIIWEIGQEYTILWNIFGDAGAQVKIDLVRSDAAIYSIAESTANVGEYLWTVPSDVTPSEDYRIRVTSTTNLSLTDWSDFTFTIQERKVIPPDSILHIPKAAVPPMIDGRIDGVWKSVPNTYMSSYGNGFFHPDDKGDLFGWFRLLWDDENLYGLCYTQDDVPFDGSELFWENDGWVIYVDGNNGKGAMYDADDQAIWIEHKDRVGSDLNCGDWVNKATFEFVNKDTSRGYVFEFRMPLVELRLVPMAGYVFGLEVQQNDNDGTVREHVSKWWARSGDEAWHDPSVFGTAMLSDELASDLLPVHRAPSPPVIDGALDQVWLTNSALISQNSYGNGSYLPDNYDDLQGEFRLMWDHLYFYGFFSFRDDSIWETNLEPWINDGWEIYFDSDNSKGTTYDGVNDNQIRFEHKDTQASQLDVAIPGSADHIEFVQVDFDGVTGYNLEFKIPMADLKLDPIAGLKFGFEAHQNDNDIGFRDHISKWWLEMGDNSWNNPSVFGTAVLIGDGEVPAQLFVTYPNASGITWRTGEEYTITWTSFGNVGPGVKIELYRGDNLDYSIVRATPNGGEYLMAVRPDRQSGNDYRIKITSRLDSLITDFSDHPFTILTSPGIKITYPDSSGIVWEMGEEYTITWLSYGDIGEYVKIELFNKSVFNKTINFSAVNDGAYKWMAPSALTPGSDYRIKISSASNRSIYDMSDSTFAISGLSSIGERSSVVLHDELYPNYPNPFNPATTFRYDVSHNEEVRIAIINLLGETVKLLVNERKAPGSYEVQWHGDDERGKMVSSGVFIVQMKAGDYVQRRKITLVR